MNMSPRIASQVGGAAFIIGNLLFLVNKLNEMSRLFLGRRMHDVISGQQTLIIILGQLALIVGYVAFLYLYTPRLARFGKVTLRIFCGGGILLAISHIGFSDLFALEPFFILVILGTFLLIIGLILFGIANLRRPILAYWQWLPLATGLMGFNGFFLFSGEEITAIFLAFRTLFAIGLVGMGLVLLLEKPTQTALVQPSLP